MSPVLTRVFWAALIAAAVMLAVLPTRTAAVAAETTPAPDVEAALVAKINDTRAAAGLPALRVDPGLTAGAREWSATMATSGSLFHDSAWGAGTAWAENVGYASQDDAAGMLHTSFMTSSGHRDNILSSTYTAVGVGAVTSGGITWVTQRFAAIEEFDEASLMVVPTTTEPEPDLILYPSPPAEEEAAPVTAAAEGDRAPAGAPVTTTPQTKAQPAAAAQRTAPQGSVQPQQTRTITPPAAPRSGNDHPREVGGPSHANGPERAQAHDRRSDRVETAGANGR